MEQRNLTAKELANALKISQGNITDWKKGRSKPSVPALEKIANYFDVSMDFLLGTQTQTSNKLNSLEEIKKYYEEKAIILLKTKYYNAFSLLNLTGFEIESLMKILASDADEISDNYSSLLNSVISIIALNHNKFVLDKVKSLIVEYNQEKLNLLAEEIKAYEHETEKDMQNLKDEHIDKLHPTMSGKKSATLDENADALLKYMDKNSIDNISLVPVVGKIAAGQPILAEEYLEGYLPVDPNIYGMASTDDYFYLRVAGQSMNLKVKNGDYALIHKQDYAENGDIVVAIVNGDDEATLKKYKKLNEQFILLEPMSSDPTIEAITIDLKTTNFRIIGKAIGQFGKF